MAALYVLFHHVGLVSITIVNGRVDFAARDLFFKLVYPGFTAVDAFFVLSGFILTSVYADLRLDGAGRFLIKRAFRIYPLHLAVLGFVLLRTWALGAPVSWPELLPVAALVHIWTLDAPSWSPQSWSIAVELLCYLLFPIALALLRRLRGPGPATSIGITLLLIGVLGYCEFWVQQHDLGSALGWRAALRGMVAFALGMALCRFSLEIPRLPRWAATCGEAASVAGLLACMLAQNVTPMALFWAALIFFLAADSGLLARALHARTLVWLGHISFSIYLLHMFILDDFLIWLAPGRLFAPTPASMALWGAALTATVFGMSHLTWRFIEEPGRRLPRRLGIRLRHLGHAVPKPLPADAN